MKALIFPGQGCQKVGMARAITEKYSWAAKMAKTADSILGRSISEICFCGPEEELNKTFNTQPAIFLVSAILTEWLKKNGFEYSAAAGHSLGEYNALYAAGAASFEDLIRLVGIRAAAMQKACPAGTGAMSAILMLSREKVKEACQEAENEGVCTAANFNSPAQIVISGSAKAVKKAGEAALAKGAKKVVPLKVSGPFHSPLMASAQNELKKALENTKFIDAKLPIYCNIDALPHKSAAELKENLLKQLVGSVLYEDTVKNMIKDGITQFVEVGPGKVLSSFNKKIDSTVQTVFASDVESLEALLKTASA